MKATVCSVAILVAVREANFLLQLPPKVAIGLLVVAYIVAICVLDASSPGALRRVVVTASHRLFSLAVAVVTAASMVGLVSLVMGEENQVATLGLNDWLLIAYLLVAIPTVEELYYRGVLPLELEVRGRWWSSAALSVGVFMIVHTREMSPALMLCHAIYAVGLTVARIAGGGVIASTLAHMLIMMWNLCWHR